MKPAVPVYKLNLYPTTVSRPNEKSIAPKMEPYTSLCMPDARKPNPANPIAIPANMEERIIFIIELFFRKILIKKPTA